jgi:DNA-binding HxlR family transcriptional regulator
MNKRERRRLDNKAKACMIEDGASVICVDPSISILGLLGKKYTVLIIGVIGNSGRKKNFNEVLSDIPGSSSTIISMRIKELLDFDILAKKIGKDGITYSLTEFGMMIRKSLLPLLKLMEEKGNTLPHTQ